MSISYLHSAVLALAAGVAAAVTITPTAAGADNQPAKPVGDLIKTYDEANAALLRGDSETWNRLVPLGQDFVLFSPFGGTPSRYSDYTSERIQRMGRFFRNGSFKQEVVQSFVSNDMIVLATIERANVEVGGLPPQDWALRVTSVFTRDGDGWKLAHRHADPLVEDVSLEESARLGRGERETPTK